MFNQLLSLLGASEQLSRLGLEVGAAENNMWLPDAKPLRHLRPKAVGFPYILT